MTTNEFFSKVIYLSPPQFKTWVRVRDELARRSILVHYVESDDPSMHVVPYQAPFTPRELADLLTFYKVIRQAAADRLDRILVLSSKIKLCRGFLEQSERVYEQLPFGWDLVYFGYSDVKLVVGNTPSTQLVYKAMTVEGTFALAINNSFYHLFLEETRVPCYNLNQHIKQISSNINLFVVIPPLVVPA